MTDSALHPSFGPVPPSEFKEAAIAPAGGAAKILRKYDPLFGMLKAGEAAKTFKVHFEREVTREEYAILEVEALDEDHARSVADKMDWSKLEWNEGNDDAERGRIVSVEEKES